MSFHAVSVRLTKKNLATDLIWDGFEGYELPDPVVHMELYDTEGDQLRGGTTTKYKAENVDSNQDCILEEGEEEVEIDLKEDPFYALTMGPSTGLMTAPLSFLRDKDSYLEVEDDDVGLNQLMGRCSLNPTDEELAKGIFVAKDCFSEAMEGTLEGKGNILELKIRIQVESH